jgi:hypothetical protein
VPSADIVIRVRGSSAQTIQTRATALERLATSIDRVDSSMRGSRAVVRLTRAQQRYTSATRQATARTDRFGTSLGGARNALDNFRLLFTRMVRIMTAYLIISTVTRLTREFIGVLATAPAKMELWSTQLATLIGNATVAGEKLELLKDVAIETPLELPDLFEGLTTLKAFDIEMSTRTLPLIADLAAVSRRTFREVSEVVGKVVAGSPTAITRSLPTLGINPIEFRKLEDELGSRFDALFQIIARKFEGFAKRSSLTLIGKLSNIKDAFFVIASDIGDAILFPVKEKVSLVLDAIESIRRSPEALEKLENKMRSVVDLTMRGAEAMVSFGKGVAKVTEAVGGLTAVLATVGAVAAGGVLGKVLSLVSKISPKKALITAALVAAAAIASKYLGSLIAADRAQLELTLSQAAFGDELFRTNELMRENAALVDAAVATRQAGALADLATRSRTASAIVEFGGDPAQAVTLAQEALAAITPLSGQGVVSFFEEALVSRLAAGIGADDIVNLNRMTGILLSMSEHFLGIAKAAREARKEADKVRLSTERLKGPQRINLDRLALPGIGRQIQDSNKIRLGRLKLALEVGASTKEETINAVMRLKQEVEGIVASLFAEGSDNSIKVALALQADIGNMDSFLSGLTERLGDSEFSDALESALRRAIKRGADVLSNGLGDLFNGKGGKSVVDNLKVMLSGIMNTLGDGLIQIGIGALALGKLLENITNPASALAAIGVGIALKAMARSLANSVKDQARSGGAGGGFSGGLVQFPTFTPANFAGGGTTVVNNISTLDAQSYVEFLGRNRGATAGEVAAIKRADEQTGGAAFGAFLPQPAGA